MNDRQAHKRAVRAAFDRAAPRYDSAAELQREVCRRLAALAQQHPPATPPARVLDAGCGTGYALPLLAGLFPRLFPRARPHFIALDFAPAMLQHLRQRGDFPAHNTALLGGDLEHLPLADASIDGAWSSLALQWCDPARALRELARVLAPGGSAWIATLGPHTLWELHNAFATVDINRHVIHFHPAKAWIGHARDAGLDLLATDQHPTHALAPDLSTLLHDLKTIGAHSVGDERRRIPLGRQAWARVAREYEQHRRADGLLPATYDLILLALRKR